MPLFQGGQVVMTSSVAAWLTEIQTEPAALSIILARHFTGDWGDLTADDKQANANAVKAGERILSAYVLFDRKLWIITEADRFSTTVLFPEDY